MVTTADDFAGLDNVGILLYVNDLWLSFVPNLTHDNLTLIFPDVNQMPSNIRAKAKVEVAWKVTLWAQGPVDTGALLLAPLHGAGVIGISLIGPVRGSFSVGSDLIINITTWRFKNQTKALLDVASQQN